MGADAIFVDRRVKAFGEGSEEGKLR